MLLDNLANNIANNLGYNSEDIKSICFLLVLQEQEKLPCPNGGKRK